jgi:hypothetical protein
MKWVFFGDWWWWRPLCKYKIIFCCFEQIDKTLSNICRWKWTENNNFFGGANKKVWLFEIDEFDPIYVNLSQTWANLVTSEAIFMKIQWKLKFSLLIFLHTNLWFLDLSQKNLNKNSTSCPSELKKIPRSWMESRKLPAKFQLCRSFQLPRTQRPQGFFRAPYWSHQKRSWPKKFFECLFWPP